MSSLTLLCDVVLMLHESFGTTMPLANRRQCTDSMNPQSEAFNSQIHTERSHILTITKNQANIYPGLHSTLRPIYPQLPLCPISFADGPAAMPQLYIRSATSYVVPRGISTLEASKPFGRAFNWVMCKACVCVCVCVCVSTPGQRVSFDHSNQAGGSRVCSWREPTKLQVQTRISKEDALSTYLQPELLTTLSNLLGLFPWFFMIPSPKPFLPQQLRR